MTRFIPAEKGESYRYLYMPVQIGGKTIYLQCHIINLVSPNLAEIEMVSDPLKTRTMVEFKDLYDMIAI